MSGLHGEFPSLKPGAVRDVRVDRRRVRPVQIEIQGQVHIYELAWRQTDDGPAVVDLRITSVDDAPITSKTLGSIKIDQLAKAAQLYDTDQAAEIGRTLRGDVTASLADVMKRRNPAERVAGFLAYFENADDETGAQFASTLRASAQEPDFSDLADQIDEMWRSVGASLVVSPTALAGVAAEVAKRHSATRRRGGRPREHSQEFLVKVAFWAQDGVLKRSVYKHVQQCAIEDGKSEYSATIPAVRHWIGLCKQAGLLPHDFARAPRRPKGEG